MHIRLIKQLLIIMEKFLNVQLEILDQTSKKVIY